MPCPNFSAPTLITITPQLDRPQEAGLPKKVKHQARRREAHLLTWVSPRDRDLSKFRVTLYNNGPAPRPSKGKAVITGRVLRASFTLKAGQIVYVNLFAIDLSGNWSRVTRLIVMPDKLGGAKAHKHKKKAREEDTPRVRRPRQEEEELSPVQIGYARAARSAIQTTSPSAGSTIALGNCSPAMMRARASRLRSPSARISTSRERARAGSVSVMRSYGA